jgi:hypothetical protein
LRQVVVRHALANSAGQSAQQHDEIFLWSNGRLALKNVCGNGSKSLNQLPQTSFYAL